MLKAHIKSWFPGVFTALARWRWQLTNHWNTRAQRKEQQRLDREVFQACGGRVASGPFVGMIYPSPLFGTACKLLGSYERELHPWVAELLTTPYEVIVNVGCGEGYYAVGLARAHTAMVQAYDTNRDLHGFLRQMARANGVAERIHVSGLCSHDELQALAGRRVLVVCDIEGGEVDLLDPARAPALAGFDVLVELHDGKPATPIKDELARRFGPTHELRFVSYGARQGQDLPRPAGLSAGDIEAAADEHRGLGLEWGLFKARGQEAAGPGQS